MADACSYAERLAARRYLYKIFNELFGTEPTASSFELLDVGLVGQSMAICQCESSERASAFLAFLEEGEVHADDWKGLYNKLFVGPGTPVAVPWEAMYVPCSERRLMSPLALEVRDTYRRFGYLPAGYPHVSDDALALELDFLYHLGEEALRAFEEDGDFEHPLKASEAFIDEHLGRWVGKFAEKVWLCDAEGVYGAAAEVLSRFVAADGEFLNEVLAQQPS